MSNFDASEVKNAVTVDVLASYLSQHGYPMKRLGREYRSGKNNGFSVYEDGGEARFKDFSDPSIHGGCFDAVALCEGITSFSEQVNTMGEFTHTTPVLVEKDNNTVEQEKTTAEDDIKALFESCYERWKRNASTPIPKKILELRGIDPEVLSDCEYVGYCFEDWWSYQRKNRLFQDCFIFWSPDFKSFCKMSFDTKTGKRKRDDPFSCQFFGKNAFFSPAGKTDNQIIFVVESQMDALALFSAGVCGVASKKHIPSKLAFLLYDNDEAGDNYTNEFLERDITASDIRSRITINSNINDLGDYIKTFNSISEAKKAMTNLVNVQQIKESFEEIKDSEQKRKFIDAQLKLEKYKNEKTGLYRPDITALTTAIQCENISGITPFFDKFSMSYFIEKDGETRLCKDPDIRELIKKLDTFGFKNPTFENVKTALLTAAEENTKDSMIDCIQALPEWDGKDRLKDFAFSCLKSSDEERNIIPILEYFWTALYARAVCTDPNGVKADTVLVLQGIQGIKKSSVLEHIGFNLSQFGTLKLKLNDPNDRVRKMKGKLIVEIPELGGMNKLDDYNDVKDFFSTRVDEFIEKYATFTTRFIRRCMLVLTTNEKNFIPDFDEGSYARRYAVIKCGSDDEQSEIDTDWLDANREQLWAQAKVLYEKNGIMWQGLKEVQKETNASYRLEVAGQDDVEEFIKSNKLYIIKNTAVIFKNLYGKEVVDLKKTQLQDMAKILSVLGFVKKKRKIKVEDVNDLNGITPDMVGQNKDVYINEKMYSENTPSSSDVVFDYNEYMDRLNDPF